MDEPVIMRRRDLQKIQRLLEQAINSGAAHQVAQTIDDLDDASQLLVDAEPEPEMNGGTDGVIHDAATSTTEGTTR